jgi:hypothetical protein
MRTLESKGTLANPSISCGFGSEARIKSSSKINAGFKAGARETATKNTPKVVNSRFPTRQDNKRPLLRSFRCDIVFALGEKSYNARAKEQKNRGSSPR